MQPLVQEEPLQPARTRKANKAKYLRIAVLSQKTSELRRRDPARVELPDTLFYLTRLPFSQQLYLQLGEAAKLLKSLKYFAPT
ncbi:MAG TPA: hypothetical protein VIJ06_06395 [Methylovirgula sp.]